MTFDQLNYFVQTARLLSITKAANTLFISHSALSKSISSLEEELGTELFIRDNRSLILTPSGKYLLEQGQYILHLLKNTCQQIRMIDNSCIGTISICMPPLFENNLFSIMRDIGLKYPNINFIFQNMEPLRVLNALTNHQADIGLAFSYQMPEDSEEFVSCNLFEDSFCAIVNASHPLAKKTVVSFADLKNECVIFPPKVGSIRTDMAILGKISQPEFGRSYHADNLEDVFFQLATNKGVSLLPKSTMAGRDLNCRLLPVADAPEIFYICLVWLKNNSNPLLPCVTGELIHAFYGKELP